MIQARKRDQERVRDRIAHMSDAEVWSLMVESTDGADLPPAGRKQLREGVRLACARFGTLRAALWQSPMLYPYVRQAITRIDRNQRRTCPPAMGELPEEVS